MTDLAVAEAFLRLARWGEPARELMGGKLTLNKTITVYRDREVSATMISGKLKPPRIVVDEIDEDTLTILHPALRCTETFVKPLLVYASFRSGVTVGRSLRRPLIDPLLKLVDRLRKMEVDPAEKVLRRFAKLRKRYPTFTSAVLSIEPPEKGGELVVVDGRKATLTDLVTCPSVYGVFRSTRFFIYVGRW